MPKSLAILFTLIAATPSLPGQEAAPTMLVSFDELQGMLSKEELRLIDARPRADYDKGHIPGAVWVDPAQVERLAAKPGALTDAKLWAAWLKPLGVGRDTIVLVYDGKRQLDAARLWWFLRYLGVERVGLINGGYALWVEEGRPTSTEHPTIDPVDRSVNLQSDRHATRADVLVAIQDGSARVIDARSANEHKGTDVRSKRGGHVPSACHLEWANLVDGKGRFLDESALREKLQKSGVKLGQPVITHCQGGGRASVDAFVFEHLGFPTRNYYLGWSDWGNAVDTPVETGDDPAATKARQ